MVKYDEIQFFTQLEADSEFKFYVFLMTLAFTLKVIIWFDLNFAFHFRLTFFWSL
jgi:hypothetical protein